MRTSYSMLSAWERRDFDAAIAMFTGERGIDNPYMIAGRTWHEAWEVETLKTRKLPAVFGAKDLSRMFQPEVKIVKQLTPWLTLSGVFDLKDGASLYEYKSGRGKAGFYARSYQHKVYQILDPTLKLAEYYCYNQYERSVTYERVHLNRDTLEDGINYVITMASEMKVVLEDMGIDTTQHDHIYGLPTEEYDFEELNITEEESDG